MKINSYLMNHLKTDLLKIERPPKLISRNIFFAQFLSHRILKWAFFILLQILADKMNFYFPFIFVSSVFIRDFRAWSNFFIFFGLSDVNSFHFLLESGDRLLNRLFEINEVLDILD